MKKDSGREIRMDQEEGEKRRVKRGPERGEKIQAASRTVCGRKRKGRKAESELEVGEGGRRDPRDEPDSMPRLVQRGGREESTGR